MALEIKQQLKLSQQLIITPQLQQAIKLLQLSQPELVELVDQELMENPLLDEDSQQTDKAAQDAQREIDAAAQRLVEAETQEVGGKEGDFKSEPSDFDWDNYLNTYNAPDFLPGNSDELPSYESTLANRTSLFDHLMWQMKLSEFEESELQLGTEILGAINEDGYMQDSLEDIAVSTGHTLATAEYVLRRIQEFDPAGVAARNLQECLLLQIKSFPEKKLLQAIIERHMANLERRDYARIAKDLKLSLEKTRHLIRIIQDLEPKPGREFTTSDAQYIVPDVYVNKIGHDWVVVLNEDGLPRLKVNSLYRSMMEENGQSKTKDYVQDKLKSAIWLIRSIHQRQRTLYRTAKTIVQFQQDFFERGLNYLKPMVLRDIANDIEMHESTVSRVTTNKYMHTPHGIFELKFFFGSGLSSCAGENSVASESIKNKIRTLIAQENRKSPLSDQDIVQQLRGSNIDVARRTVAKYRELMHILPSSKRRYND